MSNEQCSICLEDYKENDINTLLNCGHQYHYICIDQVVDKGRCCICNYIIICKANIIWQKDIKFFNYIQPGTFYKVVFNTIINSNKINETVKIYNKYKFQELIKSYKTCIELFTDRYIKIFYTRILEACNNNLTDVKLIEFKYGGTLAGFPAVFFIYGPKDKGLSFFKENKMMSLIEYIQSKFDKHIIIYPLKRNQMNQIWCKINKIEIMRR